MPSSRWRAGAADTAAQRDGARGAAQRLPDARADAQRLREVATHASELADAVPPAAAPRRARDARETAIGLRESAQRIREARFEGMISELAAGLVAGTPCPVCGALDHPDPSEVRADRVTYEQEEHATAEAERAQDRVAEIDSKLAAASAVAADLDRTARPRRVRRAGPGSRD